VGVRRRHPRRTRVETYASGAGLPEFVKAEFDAFSNAASNRTVPLPTRNESHDLLIWSYFIAENRLRINLLMKHVSTMFPLSICEK